MAGESQLEVVQTHARQSCGRVERPRPLDPLAFARAVHGLPQVTAPLNVEPRVGAIAEHAGEDECGRSCDSSALVAQLVDVFARDAMALARAACVSPIGAMNSSTKLVSPPRWPACASSGESNLLA